LAIQLKNFLSKAVILLFVKYKFNDSLCSSEHVENSFKAESFWGIIELLEVKDGGFSDC
jgi:hypothetical protein